MCQHLSNHHMLLWVMQDFKGAMHYGEVGLTMYADKQKNSEECIKAGTCQPLGGYSVWTAYPPLPPTAANSTTPRKPITLVVAQIDSNGLFHDDVKVGDGSVIVPYSHPACIAVVSCRRRGFDKTFSRVKNCSIA